LHVISSSNNVNSYELKTWSYIYQGWNPGFSFCQLYDLRKVTILSLNLLLCGKVIMTLASWLWNLNEIRGGFNHVRLRKQSPIDWVAYTLQGIFFLQLWSLNEPMCLHYRLPTFFVSSHGRKGLVSSVALYKETDFIHKNSILMS
jgi:hypothetical protein